MSPVDSAYVGSWNAYERQTGALKWSVPTATPPWSANASGANGRFFVPGGEATGVLALDAETGATIWQHETSSMVWWGMLVVGDVLYVHTEDALLQALDAATGALLWEIPVGDPRQQPFTGISYSGGVLFVGSGSSVYAIGGDGAAAPVAGAPALLTAPAVAADADRLFSWAGTLETPEPFAGPEGIAVRANGEIFVIDSLNDRFQIFSADGTFQRTWGTMGADDGEFIFHEPDGFFIGDAVFADDGSLYVTDPGNLRVQVFDPDLQFSRSIEIPSDDPGDPSRPGGIAIDETLGRLYVTDFLHGELLVFDLAGTLLDRWGATGADSVVRMVYPNGVEVAANGNVYVPDGGRSRVRIFTPEGVPVGVWGGTGAAPGQFTGPVSIVFDAQGTAYVTDYAGNRIQAIGPDGQVIGVFGSPGAGDGQFLQPTYLAMTEDGRLLVSDETNNRVVILTTPLTAPMVATPAASPEA